MTYKDKEIMARWRRGEPVSDIAQALRMTLDDVLTITNTHRKPKENDPAPKRLMDRFNI